MEIYTLKEYTEFKHYNARQILLKRADLKYTFFMQLL